jgi:hypothetical protein
MKIKIFASLVLFTLSVSVIIYGCKKKDDPKNFTNADYAGTWTVTDGCCSGGSFQVTIAASGSDGVTISNFRKCAAASGWTITGTVSGATLSIPAQNVVSATQGGPYKFSGTGTMNSASSLSIPYVMADASGNFPQNCTATCTK